MATTLKMMARVFKNLTAKSKSPIESPFLDRFSSAAKEGEIVGSRRLGLDLLGAKEYEDYRKSRYGDITHKALLVDAVGTLLVPSQPMAQIYREIGEKYGVAYTENEILDRYRWAYEQPWGRSRLRYVDDGRPFWQYIVKSSTGCSDSQCFEELYQYYKTDKAWCLCGPDAERVFKALRKAGVKLAVVSNFDTRLRPILQALKCDHWFDAVAVSAEVEAEKPNPMIFLKACDLLGVKPEDVVHVGDDRRNDLWGARDAGCDAWLWGSDVHSFKEVKGLGCKSEERTYNVLLCLGERSHVAQGRAIDTFIGTSVGTEDPRTKWPISSSVLCFYYLTQYRLMSAKLGAYLESW